MALPVEPIDYPAALAGQANGKLAPTILRTVNRVTMLADSSIRAWLALQAASAADGIALGPTSPADTYRTYAQQETLFRSRYQPFFEAGVTTDTYKLWDGGDGGVLERWFLMLDVDTGKPYATAAVPGKSNHGLALAIDIANAENPTRHAWLLANAARFGWSWELQSEIWHLHYFAGDNIPAAVLAFEQGEIVTDEEIAKVATAVWEKVINSASLGNKPAREFLKQGELAKQVAGEAASAVDMDTRLDAIDAELAAIKALLEAGGAPPGAGPTVDEIADEFAQRLAE